MLPVLCLILFGIIQFGVTFHDYITVTDASRVGARKAAVSRFVGDSGAAAEAAARTAANGLDDDLVDADALSRATPTTGTKRAAMFAAPSTTPIPSRFSGCPS